MWGKFVYREIVAPERLVFINFFSDEKGGVTRHALAPNRTRRPRKSVRFLILTPCAPGWSGTIDQLES
jgi:hypothetical protein